MTKNKHAKRFAALLALALVVCGAITAYAMWSSSLTIGGSVSAKGNWSVRITDAQLQLSNAGAELPTYDVVVYPVQLHYIASTGYYIYQVDDTAPATVSLTADEFAAYRKQVMLPRNSPNYYISGAKAGVCSIMIACNERDALIGKAQDGGASDGLVLGQAIAWALDGSANPTVEAPLTLNYAPAKAFFADVATVVDGDRVTFTAVNFSLPGAWVSYQVTVTNQGSVNANLSDYTVETSGLDSMFTVSLPEDLDQDVLAPGESCTFNIVVQVTAEEAFDVDATPFSIRLVYAQDAVDAAPAAGHSH